MMGIWGLYVHCYGQDLYFVNRNYPMIEDTLGCCPLCYCEGDIGHFWVEKNGVKISNQIFHWVVTSKVIGMNDTLWNLVYDSSEIRIDMGLKGQECGIFGGLYGIVIIDPNPNPDSIGNGVGYVVVNCPPEAKILPHSPQYCADETIQIIQNSRSKPTSYKWYISVDSTNYRLYSEDTNFVASSLGVDKYYLQLVVSNSTGIDTAYTQFEVIASPIQEFPYYRSFDLGQDGILELISCSEGEYYKWKPQEGLSCTDCRNPTATVTQDVNYSCIVYNSNGCSDTCYYELNIPFTIYIPNAFSPNGDGENDNYSVKGLNMEVVWMKIYNNWGEEVYSGDLHTPWDGKYNGMVLESGVYGYALLYKNKKTGIQQYSGGPITILR